MELHINTILHYPELWIKSIQGISDYNIPVRLKEMYNQKDFGRYEVNGDIPVAFTASNHTSGGNSGSPVVNANGELIGVNFDRCWEGTMSDVMFDPGNVSETYLNRYSIRTFYYRQICRCWLFVG